MEIRSTGWIISFFGLNTDTDGKCKEIDWLISCCLTRCHKNIISVVLLVYSHLRLALSEYAVSGEVASKMETPVKIDELGNKIV